MVTSQEHGRRVAVVTGASAGIGRACADAFLADGAHVAGIDLADSGPSHAHYTHYVCDVGDADELDATVRAITDAFGRLDVLVNNAGVHPPTRTIDSVSAHEFVELLRINLVSAFVASKAALPALRLTRGAIVNMSSLVGRAGQEGALDYCASKAGVSGLTRALAIDEAPNGVRINAVCPGAIETPLAKLVNTPGQLELVSEWAWMGRMGAADEVAQVVVFLASSAASFITGEEIVVAGGADLGYGLKSHSYYRAMAAAAQ
jgi:L-fucose dehydrogenase